MDFLYFWDAEKHTLLFKSHVAGMSKTFPLSCVAYAGDGSLCAVASCGGDVCLLETVYLLRDVESVYSEKEAHEKAHRKGGAVSQRSASYISLYDAEGILKPPDGGAGELKECADAFQKYLQEYREEHAFSDYGSVKNAKNTVSDTLLQQSKYHNPIDTVGYHFRVRHKHAVNTAISSISFPQRENDSEKPTVYFTAAADGTIEAWSADSLRELYKIATPEAVTTLHSCSVKSPLVDSLSNRQFTVHVLFASCGHRLMVIEVFGLDEIKEAVELMNDRGVKALNNSLVASGDTLKRLESLARSFRDFERRYRDRKNVGRSPFSFKFINYASERKVALRDRGISRKQVSRFVSHSGLAENFLQMLVTSDLQVSRKQLYANMAAYNVSARTICLMLAKLPFDHRQLLQCFSEKPSDGQASSVCPVKCLYTMLQAHFIPQLILHLKSERGLKELAPGSGSGAVGVIPLRDLKKGHEKAALLKDAQIDPGNNEGNGNDEYFYCTSVSAGSATMRTGPEADSMQVHSRTVAHFSPAKQLNRIRRAQNNVTLGIQSSLPDTLLEKDSLKFPNFSMATSIADIQQSDNVPKLRPKSAEKPRRHRPKALTLNLSAVDSGPDSPRSLTGVHESGTFPHRGRSLHIPKQLDLIDHPGENDPLRSFDDVNRALSYR